MKEFIRNFWQQLYLEIKGLISTLSSIQFINLLIDLPFCLLLLLYMVLATPPFKGLQFRYFT